MRRCNDFGENLMNGSVCILTAYSSGYADLAAISVPHMRRYASLQGCEFRAIQRDDCVRGRGWIKIELLSEALTDGFDFVLWLDIDTLIVRKTVDIRSAASAGSDLHMIWIDLPPGFPDPSHFNSGVMLIRATEWARGFFRSVWETGQLRHHWHDQATILHLLGYDDILRLGPSQSNNPNRDHLAKLDVAWNSIVGLSVSPDPIIHHYAGIGDHELRLGMMRSDVETLDCRAKASPEIRREFLQKSVRGGTRVRAEAKCV